MVLEYAKLQNIILQREQVKLYPTKRFHFIFKSETNAGALAELIYPRIESVSANLSGITRLTVTSQALLSRAQSCQIAAQRMHFTRFHIPLPFQLRYDYRK